MKSKDTPSSLKPAVTVAIVMVTAVVFGVVFSVTSTQSRESSGMQKNSGALPFDPAATTTNAPTASAVEKNSGVSPSEPIMTTSAPTIVPVVCPCYTREDIDFAMGDVTSGDGSVRAEVAKTCTGQADNNQIEYSQLTSEGHPLMMGYGFDKRSFPTCRDLDTVHLITDEEVAVCAEILDEKCGQYKASLEALLPNVGCPCFEASHLSTVINKVNSDILTLNGSSCNGDSAFDLVVSYTKDAGGYPEYYGWGVTRSNSDKSCIHYDTLQTLSSQAEWDACEKIVSDACRKMGYSV